MASNGCVHVTFCCTVENSFYFQAFQPGSDLEEDDFKKNNHHHEWCIRSHQDGIGCLILNKENQKGSLSPEKLDSKLNIETYRSNSLDTMEKMPVMIYAIKDEQTLVVCYKDGTIQAEKMTPPSDISGVNHKALFYQTKLPGTNKFKFVSSMDHSKVLGVVHEKNSLYKLVLIADGNDYVDESTVFNRMLTQ